MAVCLFYPPYIAFLPISVPVIRRTAAAILVAAHAVAMAADAIRIPPVTTVGALERASVPITGTLNVPANAAVRIIFRFTPSTFRPSGAVGGGAAALLCPAIDPTNVVVNGRTDGEFSIECNTAQAVADGVVAMLTITGLPTTDVEGTLRPLRVLVNGVERSDVELQGGLVRISEGGPRPTLTEGVSGNAPNPVVSRTEFRYSIAQAGTVRYFIRDVAGKLYAELPSEELQAGTYTKEFVPDTWSLSSGVYIFQLVSPTTSHYHTFVVQK